MPQRGPDLAEGFGFLSKRPLRDLKFLAPEHGIFGAWIATVDLGGRAVQEVTLASTSQLMEPRSRTWAPDLVAQAGLPVTLLPELVEGNIGFLK